MSRAYASDLRERVLDAVAAGEIVAGASKRWSIETTFEESRAHLEFETQRQWADLAMERTSPFLLSVSATVTLVAHRLYQDGCLPVRASAWYTKPHATFSDVLAAVRLHLWDVGRGAFFPIASGHRPGRNSPGLSAMLAPSGLFYALTCTNLYKVEMSPSFLSPFPLGYCVSALLIRSLLMFRLSLAHRSAYGKDGPEKRCHN
jgi:hypothetical protein